MEILNLNLENSTSELAESHEEFIQEENPMNLTTEYGVEPDIENHDFDYEPKGLQSKEQSRTPDETLRLLYDYYKDISKEPVFKQREEKEVSIKMRKCESRAREIKVMIDKLLEEKRKNGNGRSGSEKEVSKQIKILSVLMKLYLQKARRLRERFVKANLRLVLSIAREYMGKGLPLPDVIQEGNLGLIRAVESFDHTKDYKFSTYASWWIKQKITRAIIHQVRTIRIPSYVIERTNHVRGAMARLEEENGKTPVFEEIAKEAGMTVGFVKRVLLSNEKMLSLDSVIWQGEKTVLMDSVADPNSIPPDSLIASAYLPQNIDDALLKLSPREREILRMRFGIGYEKPSTLKEVGKKLNLTRERIRQIEKTALYKLGNPRTCGTLVGYLE
ncbi:MAG: sigma-70 family RNA polymerase sigma factor [Candidatus Dadabacteria bacterium]|nr:sigma-70 family RNA polymerase sigma factor [Candidatus Dadabacteria bacterium]